MTRAWLTLMVLAGACGDPTPVEQCDDLVELTCDRAVDCVRNSGTHAECVADVQRVIPCGRATSVSASYDRCMDQMASNTCAALFPDDPTSGMQELSLPADCNNVIITARTAANTLPAALEQTTSLAP